VVALLKDGSVYWLRINLDLLLGLAVVMFGAVGLYLRSGRVLRNDVASFQGFSSNSVRRFVVIVRQQTRRTLKRIKK
jgi:hypothetical protein